jgi:hypothetical protein
LIFFTFLQQKISLPLVIIKPYRFGRFYTYLNNRTTIYLQMRKNKALLIGKKTFIKYCNKLGFGKKKYYQKCCKNRIGLVGKHYLDMLHADITYYTLGNDVTTYILNIVDNATRKLLYSNASMQCDSTFVSTALQPIINK